MFELLATVDPFSALLGSLWLFAAGMFPVGFMLGSSCSPCCGEQPCDACVEGNLPETLTVAISGITETTKGPDLATLTFSSCYGSGASGSVTAPGQSAVGGNPAGDRGPITAVSLAGGGSGYAQLGRVAPALTVSGGSGTGATFTPTLSVAQDACGRETWSIASIAASGGTGYVDGEWLSIAASEGDTQIQAAAAKLYVGRSEPTITLNGTATTTVQLADNGDNTWRIAGVTVTDGGSGYSELGLVTFNAGPDGVVVPNQGAIARARVIHEEPSNANAIITISTSGGSGAVLQPVWELLPQNQWPAVNRKTYRLASVTVVNGGSGYQQFERIEITFPAVNASVYGLVYQQAYVDVDAVDGNGAIEAVYVDPPGGPDGGSGSYRGARTDQLHSVLLAPETVGPPGNVFTACPTCRGGSYYRNDPTARRVVVTAGGSYYREDASVPPYVATVTVGVSQIPPSDGTGAELSAVIDDDPESETFGEITGLTIEDGGDGYLAHELFASCLGRFDGRSIVVRRNYPFWHPPNCCPFFPISLSPDTCTYGYTCANTGDPCSLEAEAVRVDYRGPNEPMTVFLMLHQRGQTTLPLGGDYYYPAAYGLLTAQENVQDCSNMNITAYGSQSIPPEATAVITSGGEYEETDACKRITEEDMAAVYTEVSWGDITVSGGGRLCGWRSYVAVGGFDGDTTGPWCEELKQQPGNESVRCFERRIIYPVAPMIVRNAIDCGWEWLTGGQLCVTIERRIIPGADFSAMIRLCVWCYPITDVTYDEETLLPSGIQLGEPTYYTQPASPESGGTLLSEAEVCQNPGTPTITISSLP